MTDTPWCNCSPTTAFISNILYASSVFNKIDVCACQCAIEWMQGFEAYQQALEADSSGNERAI